MVTGYAVVLALVGVLLRALAAMPVLSPAVYAHIYGSSSNGGSQQDSGDAYGFPQSLADRFGWPEQVALIAQVYRSLPAEEQRETCIFTSNYGQGVALVESVALYHLPPTISGHNAFYIWGPDGVYGSGAHHNQCATARCGAGVQFGDAGRQDVMRGVRRLQEQRADPDLARAKGHSAVRAALARGEAL